MSHDTVANVQKQLRADNWTVVWKSALAPGDKRPPFSDLTVRVDAFEDLGSRGPIELLFLNDRLYRVVFSPADADRYFRELERVRGVVRSNASTLRVEPSTTLQLTTEGGLTVVAEDECIASELSQWVVRYASGPTHPRCMA